MVSDFLTAVLSSAAVAIVAAARAVWSAAITRMRGRAAVVAVLAAAVPVAAAQRPNVLLVVVDMLRADHLGSYGYGRATSPRIDALAASGGRRRASPRS